MAATVHAATVARRPHSRAASWGNMKSGRTKAQPLRIISASILRSPAVQLAMSRPLCLLPGPRWARQAVG